MFHCEKTIGSQVISNSESLPGILPGNDDQEKLKFVL